MRIKSMVEFEARNRKEVTDEQYQHAIDNSPTWQTVKGVGVYRVKDSKYVAAPCSGRKNSAKWDILDIEANEYVCQLTRKEMTTWLYKNAIYDLDK